MEVDVTNVIPLSPEENAVLAAPFSEKEVFVAILQTEQNKGPGPDGFLAEFYQKCWGIIKGYLMPMFEVLYNNNLLLFHLNFGIIMLLHKKEDAV
jgi:hypothetical protein